MSSTSEVGHAKNVSSFQELISFCNGYGATYNPSKASLKMDALKVKLEEAQAALQEYKEAKTAYNNATNARENLMVPLKPLVTRIINALAATDATLQTVDDARSIVNKIRGTGTRSGAKAVKQVGEGNPEPVRSISRAQQSYDKQLDNFAQLLTILSAEPSYAPNENDLKLETLKALMTEITEKNKAVASVYTTLSNARIKRNKVFYDPKTGFVDIALDVKTYAKSVFGPKSPQFKQVSGLRYTRSNLN